MLQLVLSNDKLKHIPQAVILDFGGVLCFHPDPERFDPIARTFGLRTPDFLRLFWSNRVEYDAGRMDARDYWLGIAQGAGRSLDESLLPALIRQEVELWSAFDERVLGWAAQLQARDFRTAILSNLPRPLGEELRITPGFLDPFDHVTFSYELGLVKPEAGIYEDAIRGLSVQPGAALFLDDRPENVEGARAAGLLAEVYTTWDALVEEILPRYGLPAPLPDAARFQ